MTMIKSRRFVGVMSLALVGALALTTQTVMAGGGGSTSDASWLQGMQDQEVTWSAAEDGAGAAALPSGAKNIEFVSLANGCRIFDTRNAVGAFSAGQSRDLSVRNANIPGQGGKAGGCNIPNHAVAVDLSLSTTAGSPSTTGYARVGPGGTSPTATVLQFLKGQGTSVTTTSGLNGSGQMRVFVFGASTHLVGDVVGYWQRTLHATVDENGTLVRGNGVIQISHSLTGFYVVRFERDITECTPAATATVPVTGSDGNDVRAQASLNSTTGTGAQEIFVLTKAYNSTTTQNHTINLTVEC